MFDHVEIKVKDYEKSRDFYRQALAPLGIKLTYEEGRYAGFGPGEACLWIAEGAAAGRVHLAFKSPDRATVDAFHRAALAASGRDNGAPGLRPDYGPGYYAAFALDPDGNNVELVYREPK